MRATIPSTIGQAVVETGDDLLFAQPPMLEVLADELDRPVDDGAMPGIDSGRRK